MSFHDLKCDNKQSHILYITNLKMGMCSVSKYNYKFTSLSMTE